MSVWYPPHICPHCNGAVRVRLASVAEGEVTSWRTGINLVPNWSHDQKEYYDAAWCGDCQTQFFVEGR